MRTSIVVIAAWLAALMTTSSAQESPAVTLLHLDQQACALRARHKEFKTFAALVNCENEAEYAYVQRLGFPWMDLEVANETAHLSIAQQLDDKKITLEDATLADARADAEMAAQVQQRTQEVETDRRRRLAVDRQREANLCYANALMAPGMTGTSALGYAGEAYQACLEGRPPPQPPRSVDTYCSRGLDGSFNCTSR